MKWSNYTWAKDHMERGVGSRKGNPWTSGRGLITSQGIIGFTGPALRLPWATAVAVAALAVIVATAQAANVTNGSGVVIGAQGEVLTNAHVVAFCAQITLRTSSGDSAPAQVIAQDEQNDLAVAFEAKILSLPSPSSGMGRFVLEMW
jgi:S1-C subfamily serine protease